MLGYVVPLPPEGFASWEEYDASLPPEEQGSWFAILDPTGAGPRMYFQRVPEGKVAKNRLHLDVRVGTGLEGAERLAGWRPSARGWSRSAAYGCDCWRRTAKRVVPGDAGRRGHRVLASTEVGWPMFGPYQLVIDFTSPGLLARFWARRCAT